MVFGPFIHVELHRGVVLLYLSPESKSIMRKDLPPKLLDCPASTTFSGQRQLFFPIGDNYKLYEGLILG
jgi:hypothetical protein